MSEAWIVDGVRTPIGRHGGALASVRPDDLAAVAIKALVQRTGIDPESIDDVLFGCINQAGEDNRNVARMALLLAGLPVTVPGQTLNRLCGSGMQTVLSAFHAISAGEGDVFIAGGVESMSRAPFVMPKAETAFSRNNAVYDTTIGWRFINPKLEEMYGVEFGIDKRQRLDYHHSLMTHAMLFTGVDVTDKGVRRWRVENSWGAKQSGRDGFYTMNDSWFDEYMFEIAAHKSYLSKEMLAALETEPVVLPAWDPMGSLACSNCGTDAENR